MSEDTEAVGSYQPKYQPGPDLLGEAVRRRRELLGLTQEEVDEKYGGPSVGSLRTIENAQADRYRTKTLFSLDGALSWPRGASLMLLSGDPVLLENDSRYDFQWNYAPGSNELDRLEFDRFVDHLISGVSDADIEKYGIEIRMAERPSLTLGRAVETDTAGAVAISGRGDLRAPAAEITGHGKTIPLGQDIYAQALLNFESTARKSGFFLSAMQDLLDSLSIRELDRVIAEAQTIRRLKYKDVRRRLRGLAEPESLGNMHRLPPNSAQGAVEALATLINDENSYEHWYRIAEKAAEKVIDLERTIVDDEEQRDILKRETEVAYAELREAHETARRAFERAFNSKRKYFVLLPESDDLDPKEG